MVTEIITVSVRADVKERFRRVAAATYRKKKGYLGRALTEAMEDWAREKEEGGTVATALRYLGSGSTSEGRITGAAMSCTSDEDFSNTIIIAYAFDRSDERKWQPCQR